MPPHAKPAKRPASDSTPPTSNCSRSHGSRPAAPAAATASRWCSPWLEASDLHRIKPDDHEVDAWQLADPTTAHSLLHPLMAQRLQSALAAPNETYVEQRPNPTTHAQRLE